ncbi:hypothetical protein P3875_04945 [Myroides sp. JBRI-B21084]|uniref:hypothetical protein n=1 Tax=Myroides sp. JBRI-B21084 TaxID=3119977 RepID=UPI0026E3DF24|nr:hypothetical protein [Paenimyroides cloacae]WKW47411.1 hypothetical protein P3875_04945 [Paenimyroides cloacae]
MKKIVYLAFCVWGISLNAQNKNEFILQPENKDTRVVYAVAAFEGTNSGMFTVSGKSSPYDLDLIVKSAKENYGIDISFVNMKFNNNTLEYCELLFFTEGKSEILQFGTENLKLLPFSVKFSVKKEKESKKRFLTIKNDKNKRENYSNEVVYNIS